MISNDQAQFWPGGCRPWSRNPPIPYYEALRFTTILASGKTESLVELAQLLAWSSAFSRLPNYRALTSSRGHFQRRGRPIRMDSGWKMEFDLTLGQLRHTDASDGTCWRPMFANSVVVEGFPVPKRTGETGLEISFEAMVTLNRIFH